MRSGILTLVMLLAFIPMIFGKVIEKEQAQQAAYNFLNERISSQQVDWAYGSVSLTYHSTFTADGQPAIYVYTIEPEGFILISAEDRFTPVLGYSYKGSFPEQAQAQNYYSYLQEYVVQVKWIRTQPSYEDGEATALWNKYLSGNTDFSVLSTTDVEPMMTCLWNQDYPYNAFCPSDAGGPGGHVYAGCVATAMSMIMYYYRYPVQGIGTHSYYCAGYGTQSVNYGTTSYNWDAMQDEIGSTSGQSIPAIAQLQYHAGVAVNMQYGIDGSSAYSTDVAPALISHFGYSTSSQYAPRSSYTASGWEALVVEQLDAAKPLYYSGVDPTPTTGGGHAFILDGYQVTGSTKMFHFNFGWSGSGNGYYTLANPAPSGTPGFSTQQAIVRNTVPNVNYPYGCDSHTITAIAGSFEDGSSPRLNYDPNSNCTWLIAPADSVNRIFLSFVKFDVDPSDSLYIYDGDNDGAPLLGSFSGTTLPGDVTSTGDKMFVKFVTDGSSEAAGWEIQFNGALPVFCGGTVVLTDGYGTFSDGSGDYSYNNNSVCRWKIQPPYAMDLTLYFNNFDLADGDELSVYSLGTSTTLLETLTGNQVPDPITSPTNAFLLMFKTNNYNTSAGFDGFYTISNVGKDELTGISNLSISPNPATGYTIMRFFATETNQASVTISDFTGQKLFRDTWTMNRGSIEKRISLENLTPGVYILTLSSEKGKISKKLIVQ